MPSRLTFRCLGGPFESDTAAGRSLTILGEAALCALQFYELANDRAGFSPVEFAAGFAAILAAGGFNVAKAESGARADRLQVREQDRKDANCEEPSPSPQP